MSFSGRRPTNESIYLQRLRRGYRLDQNTRREVHAVDPARMAECISALAARK